MPHWPLILLHWPQSLVWFCEQEARFEFFGFDIAVFSLFSVIIVSENTGHWMTLILVCLPFSRRSKLISWTWWHLLHEVKQSVGELILYSSSNKFRKSAVKVGGDSNAWFKLKTLIKLSIQLILSNSDLLTVCCEPSLARWLDAVSTRRGWSIVWLSRKSSCQRTLQSKSLRCPLLSLEEWTSITHYVFELDVLQLPVDQFFLQAFWSNSFFLVPPLELLWVLSWHRLLQPIALASRQLLQREAVERPELG